MGKSDPSKAEGEYDPDPIVDLASSELGAGETSIPAVVELVGYVGRSSNADNIRVYSDLSFSTYFEVAKKSIKKRVLSEDPYGPSTLILPQDLRLEVVATNKSVEAGMLAGSIASNYYAPTAAAGAFPEWSGSCWCPHTKVTCPTGLATCVPCAVSDAVCLAGQGREAAIERVTHVAICTSMKYCP